MGVAGHLEVFNTAVVSVSESAWSGRGPLISGSGSYAPSRIFPYMDVVSLPGSVSSPSRIAFRQSR